MSSEAPRPPRLAPFVTAFGLIAVVISGIVIFWALRQVPNQRALQTPVVATPNFSEQSLETRVANADRSKGELIFQKYACTACHHATTGVGPTLKGMGERAGNTRANYSAAAYLYESITQPNAYISEGYSAGIMVQNYKDQIGEDEIYDLIAWLLTQ